VPKPESSKKHSKRKPSWKIRNIRSELEAEAHSGDALTSGLSPATSSLDGSALPASCLRHALRHASQARAVNYVYRQKSSLDLERLSNNSLTSPGQR
jgi:hypothetical protein